MVIGMTRILLLRVFVETSNGGYYSPLHEDGCATLLPIPDDKRKYRTIPSHLLAGNIVDECNGRELSQYYPVELGENPIVHRDPRLDKGFYTGYYAPKGRIPRRHGKRLGRGDYLVFIAGLARYPRGFWEKRRRLAEIHRAFTEARRRGLTGIYIVGYIVVEDIVDVNADGWSRVLEKYSFLKESPHYYRVNDKPVAVIGKPVKTRPPIMIADSTGSPTIMLAELIGRENALKLAKNHYRKSRVLNVEPYILEKLVKQ